MNEASVQPGASNDPFGEGASIESPPQAITAPETRSAPKTRPRPQDVGTHNFSVSGSGRSDADDFSKFFGGGRGPFLWMTTDGLVALVRALSRPCECEVATSCFGSSRKRRCHVGGVGVHRGRMCRGPVVRWWVSEIAVEMGLRPLLRTGTDGVVGL